MGSAKKPKGEDALWSRVRVTKAPARKPKPVFPKGTKGTGQSRVVDPNVSPLERAMQRNFDRAMNAMQGTPGSATRKKSRRQTRSN